MQINVIFWLLASWWLTSVSMRCYKMGQQVEQSLMAKQAGAVENWAAISAPSITTSGWFCWFTRITTTMIHDANVYLANLLYPNPLLAFFGQAELQVTQDALKTLQASNLW